MNQRDFLIDVPLEQQTMGETFALVANAPDLPEGFKVDWFRIITQLDREGQNVPRIAERTGIPECRIKGWKLHGYSVKLEDALRMIKLWLAITRNTIEQLPIERDYKA